MRPTEARTQSKRLLEAQAMLNCVAWAFFIGSEMQPRMTVAVDTQNLDNFIRDFYGLLDKVLEVAGRNVERRAKRIIVDKDIIDTGDTLGTTESRRTLVPLERVIGPTTEYAPGLEFGTVLMAARPFMTPALEAERRPFLTAVTKVVEKANG